MSPHTLLKSGASVSTDVVSNGRHQHQETLLGKEKPSNYSGDFLSYVGNLIDRASTSDQAGLLSPTEETGPNLASLLDSATSMKDNIENVILRGNQAPTKRNATRFEINRNGQKVAVIMLPRAAYRIGETIPAVVDFQTAEIASYAVRCSLETSETVDPSIALRSSASIHRVTRKVHASQSETTVSAGRVSFSSLIPINATPEFTTSGVSMQWSLCFEFVTDRAGMLDEYDDDANELMEEITKDDRGTVQAALQGLPCEVFEVTVPVRVYGASPVADQYSEVKMRT